MLGSIDMCASFVSSQHFRAIAVSLVCYGVSCTFRASSRAFAICIAVSKFRQGQGVRNHVTQLDAMAGGHRNRHGENIRKAEGTDVVQLLGHHFIGGEGRILGHTTDLYDSSTGPRQVKGLL